MIFNFLTQPKVYAIIERELPGLTSGQTGISVWRRFLQIRTGSTDTSINALEMEFLRQMGVTPGTAQDMWNAYLTGGTLGDKLRKLATTGNFTQLAQYLTDPFNTVDTQKWNNFTPAEVTANGTLNISTILAGNYKALYSLKNYNLTGSQVKVDVTNKGNLGLASYEFYPILLLLDGSNQVDLLVNGSGIRARSRIAGANTLLGAAPEAWSDTAHRFLRIREAAGTIFFDKSADNNTWTNMFSLANPFAVTSLQVIIQVGTFAAEVSTTTAQVNSINL